MNPKFGNLSNQYLFCFYFCQKRQKWGQEFRRTWCCKNGSVHGSHRFLTARRNIHGYYQATNQLTTNIHCACCMLSCFSCVRVFASPWIVARQAPLSMGFSRQEYGGGLPFPPPGHLPDPGIELASLMSSELAGGFLTTSATWAAPAQSEQCASKRET